MMIIQGRVSMKFYQSNQSKEIYINLLEKELSEDQINVMDVKDDIDMSIHKILVEVIGHFVKVKIGQEPHPMIDVHYIDFILIKTNKGLQYKSLDKTDKPMIHFLISEDEVVQEVYSHCNVHGLNQLNIN